MGPYHFRIHKRWVKKRTSELHVFSPRPGQWTGAEADGELERILSEHMDRALVDALFVRQNDSHEGIAAVGIPSLTAALEEQTGANAVAEDSELLTRIEAEYKEYFTAKTDKPHGTIRPRSPRCQRRRRSTRRLSPRYESSTAWWSAMKPLS